MTQGVVFLGRSKRRLTGSTDLIAAHQADPRVRSEPFQVWTLSVEAETRNAVAAMTDGNSTQPATRQDIPHMGCSSVKGRVTVLIA